jgi:uncharacterized protein (TIGR02996 family)
MTDRPEVIALLSDCKENPEDDTPRLVLADWLEERDDPRGSFLRAQVLASRLPEGNSERKQYEDIAERLGGTYEIEWLGQLLPALSDWEFSRGLIQAKAMGDRLLAPEVEATVGSETLAWVESFRLFDAGAHLAGLARAGILSGVRALNLMYNHLGDESLAGWLATGPLPLLQELDLFNNGLTLRSAITLADRSRELSSLQRLNLGDNNLGRSCLFPLADPVDFERLEELQLERVGLLDPERGPLPGRYRGAGLRALRTLELQDNELRPGGLEAILTRFRLPPLRRLRLRSARLGDEGVRILTSLPEQVAQLEWLSLSACALTDAGVELLGNCPHLARVRTLILDGNQVTARGAVTLLNSPHLVALRDLSLQDMMFNAPPDVGALLAAPRLAQMASLGCSALRLDPIAAGRLLSRYPALTLV